MIEKFKKLFSAAKSVKKVTDLFGHFDEILAKLHEARTTLDEIRLALDEADTILDNATSNGQMLPDNLRVIVHLADGLRKLVDLADDAADRAIVTPAPDRGGES